ncbi:MAG: sugar phosphate isomerase/epimerase family protein [Pirellulaceae bacterium]
MLIGYNTNGFAHHDPLLAVELLAELGYRSVAITIDHGVLNPYAPDVADQSAKMRTCLENRSLRSVIETGARFLLDPRHKHEPTLMSADARARERRVDFLCRAADMAADLGSDCVSLWSGTLREPLDDEAALERLAEGLDRVLAYARPRGVTVAFEPEPGMFVESMRHYERLLQCVDGENLRLTLDLGHLHCMGEVPIADFIRRWRSRIANIHIEDMRAGAHEHLMFGEGEIDFPPIIEALSEVGYQGGLHVELSRHSHEAPHAARRAYAYLQPLIEAAAPPQCG